MSTSLVGTTASARDVLQNIHDRSEIFEDEIAEFMEAMGKHDFSDPFSVTNKNTPKMRLYANGNYLLYANNHFGTRDIYILQDGSIVEKEKELLTGWIESLTWAGWSVAKGTGEGFSDPECQRGDLSGRKAHVTLLDAYTPTVIITFITWEPDGRQTLRTIRAKSHTDGGRAARNLTKKIANREKALTTNKEESINFVRAKIRDEFLAACAEYGTQPDYSISSSSWESVTVQYETLDSMLYPERYATPIGFTTRVDQADPVPNHEGIEDLRTAIRLRAEKETILRTKGRLISPLAETIWHDGKGGVRANTKWIKAEKDNVLVKRRLTIKNGYIGGEIIIHRDKKKILRLLNASFRIHNVSIPDSVFAGMEGRPLSDYIQAPYVTDKMIITRVFRTPDGVRGRLQDEGAKPYEAP